MVSCPQDGNLGERTGLRGGIDASLEHGGFEGLKAPRGRYQKVIGPPGARGSGGWK